MWSRLDEENTNRAEEFITDSGGGDDDNEDGQFV